LFRKLSLEGSDMTIDSDWRTRLKTAAEALERSAGAPDWLRWALRDALIVALDLAPVPKAEPTPPNFFYPH
jgi:hypothetical protein